LGFPQLLKLFSHFSIAKVYDDITFLGGEVMNVMVIVLIVCEKSSFCCVKKSHKVTVWFGLHLLAAAYSSMLML